ncbi:uncharacterized protein LOC125759539 isoform X1 [Rhipicephalus sanguineus]|uniref:uncharacterized protein LOC125759539 isoform X1 n=1 Tax=Rhipicephalus sanguineus TaxID=34632 RepID=UPI0020C2C0A8|nr:uncharacterized protein LOC125759539 isoform X1 [Rhipicephalus sanguineus]
MEVGEGECLTATVPLARCVIQSNPSITPLAGGHVTAVASTSSSAGGEEAEDKAAKRRARDAERKRAKRAADAELRAREAAAQRQRRAKDPEMCARYAAVRRQRRVENAEVRVRDAAQKRRRRAADPRVKQREAEYKRRRRQADPATARALDRATQAAARARKSAQQDARFKLVTVILSARSTRVVQGNCAVQRDQSTSCEKGVSKSTQANLFPHMVFRWAQTEEVQDFHDASSSVEVPLLSKEEPSLVTFLNRSAMAIRMLLHANETQQSQAEWVTKQHPLDCRGHSLVAAGPPKGTEGIDAFAQSCITKEVTDKTTWCAGISEAELYSPKVSSWMQSEDLEDSDDYS